MANKPLTHNYHCHTARCGHAIGEDEEYVLSAIKGGYQFLGFSDHVFLKGIEQPGMRGSYRLLGDYISSIHSLAAKYEKDISLGLGFESEWLGEDIADYYASLRSKGFVQYLICGQHCFLDNRNKLRWYIALPDKKEATLRYTDAILKAMDSGLFLYFAHPDYFMTWHNEWDETAEACARRIISKAKEKDIVLEINMGPSRRSETIFHNLKEEYVYPFGPFWDLVVEAKVRTIFGVDAHAPSDLLESPFDYFRLFAKKHGLAPLESLPLLSLSETKGK